MFVNTVEAAVILLSLVCSCCSLTEKNKSLFQENCLEDLTRHLIIVNNINKLGMKIKLLELNCFDKFIFQEQFK